MNWLIDNPISQMPGPAFLALYAAVIAFLLAEARWRVRRPDPGVGEGPEPIPTKPDPVEIAYLRGGENEVTRLLAFDLIRRGYLKLDEKQATIEPAEDAPAVAKPSPIEQAALDFFRKPRKPAELFRPGGLSGRLKAGFGPMADSLRERGLLASPDQVGAAWKAWFGGALMILAVGGFKLFVAMAKGKTNVGFLFVFAAFGLIALIFACWAPRVTRRGKEYLASLRVAFQGLKPRVAEPADPGSLDPALTLVPAVFGVAALVGTPYAYAPSLFRTAAISSAGGCGASGAGCGGIGGVAGGGGCGGGDGGGGGCGGGCGGCGGG